MTAPVPTDLPALKLKIADAAMFWLIDMDCMNALAALQTAHDNYMAALKRVREERNVTKLSEGL